MKSYFLFKLLVTVFLVGLPFPYAYAQLLTKEGTQAQSFSKAGGGKCRKVFETLAPQRRTQPAFLTPADPSFSGSSDKNSTALPGLEELLQGFSQHKALFDSSFSKVTLPLSGNQAVDTFRKAYNLGFFTDHSRFITYWYNGSWAEREVFAVHNKGVLVMDEYANLYHASVIALRTARVSPLSRHTFLSNRQRGSQNSGSLNPGQEVSFFNSRQSLKYGQVKGIKADGKVYVTYREQELGEQGPREQGPRHLLITMNPKSLLVKEEAPHFYRHIVSAPVGPHGRYINVKVKQLFSDNGEESGTHPQKLFVVWKAEGEMQGQFINASDLRPFKDPFDPRYMKALKNSELQDLIFLHTPGVKNRIRRFLNNKLHPEEGQYQPYQFVNPSIEGISRLNHRLSPWVVDTRSAPLQRWMHKATTIIKNKTGLQPRANHSLSLREQNKIYQVYLNDIVPKIGEIEHSPHYDFLRSRLLTYGRRDLGQSLDEGAAVCLELSLFGMILFGEYGIKAKVGIGTLKDEPKSSHAWIQTFDEDGNPLRIIDSNYTNELHVSWEEYKDKALLSENLGEWTLTPSL